MMQSARGTHTASKPSITHRQPLPLPISPITLPLAFGVPPSVPDIRMAAPAELALPLMTLEESIVVRLFAVFFNTGAVLGLSTLFIKDPSLSLFTIRLAWLAVNMFSLGGDPLCEFAVGLRRLCCRVAES